MLLFSNLNFLILRIKVEWIEKDWFLTNKLYQNMAIFEFIMAMKWAHKVRNNLSAINMKNVLKSCKVKPAWYCFKLLLLCQCDPKEEPVDHTKIQWPV